ncbi:MAG: hypothetical protein K0R15_1320 [Clostridiales bacterium]|jgi:hypothetical protein|nr:hypothetical protein [Clostridiales bacterium]
MNNKTLFKTILIYIGVVALLVSSYSLLCIPYASNLAQNGDVLLRNLWAAVFWLTLILGYGTFFIVELSRKKTTTKTKKGKKALPGIIKFYSNSLAKVVDIIFAVSIILILVLQFINGINEYLSYALLSTSLFLFHMHCFVNGENYRWIANKNNKELKQQ